MAMAVLAEQAEPRRLRQEVSNSGVARVVPQLAFMVVAAVVRLDPQVTAGTVLLLLAALRELAVEPLVVLAETSAMDRRAQPPAQVVVVESSTIMEP